MGSTAGSRQHSQRPFLPKATMLFLACLTCWVCTMATTFLTQRGYYCEGDVPSSLRAFTGPMVMTIDATGKEISRKEEPGKTIVTIQDRNFKGLTPNPATTTTGLAASPASRNHSATRNNPIAIVSNAGNAAYISKAASTVRLDNDKKPALSQENADRVERLDKTTKQAASSTAAGDIRSIAFDKLYYTSSTHRHEFTTILEPNFAVRGDSLCLLWQVNSDVWWTHHPDWAMGDENATHYCFRKMQNPDKAKRLRDIYQVQFQGNCSTAVTKRMFSSGWNADITNIADGIFYAVTNGVPMAVADNERWHYADPSKKQTEINKNVPPACEKRHMPCYFLPLTYCKPNNEGVKDGLWTTSRPGRYQHQWWYEYVTRPQTWLRHELYKFRVEQQILAPCTAMHVRRGDVVLHTSGYKRRYHAIAEYMNQTSNIHHNVFLLTDDANAINEAKVEFPNQHWMYIDRPRFKSNTGGWEQQIPSNDPTREVVYLMGEFQLVRQCDQLICSRSGFAAQLWAEMSESGKNISFYDLDSGRKRAQVYSWHHDNTTYISKEYTIAASSSK